MRSVFFVAAALISVLTAPALRSSEAPHWVEAEGLAYINGSHDSDAARRRALGEALVSAAYAGGAAVQGHTAVLNARVTSDMAIVRPSGRVLRHDVLFAQVDQGHWRVRIRALVGKGAVSVCAARRKLTLNATPPRISVPPQAQAWSVESAKVLAQDIFDEIEDHPFVVLESISAPSTRRVAAGFDYKTLTRGERAMPAGNQRLDTTIDVTAHGPRIELILTLSLVEPTGRTFRKSFRRATRVEPDGVAALLRNARRSKGEKELVAGIREDVSAYFDSLVCRYPEVQITGDGDVLSVPIGRRQGLTRGSLAFVDDPGATIAILEIVSLGDRRTTLRPLDPTRPAGSFSGRRVYFVETGQ
ncbi:MAG: hypothetical protein AAGA15_00610 [Pseudomonadota bacterium]